jgi:Gpi18-like mannosyltransferase
MGIKPKEIKNTNSYFQLFLYGLFFEIVYLVLVLLTFFRDYLGDTPSIPPSNSILSKLFILWILVASFIYTLLIFRKIQKNFFWLILIFYFIFSFTLLFTWPLGSSDIFNYIYRARVFTYYEENPFLVPPANFDNDLLATFVWQKAKSIPMIYGPLWAFITFVPSWLFRDSLVLSLLFLKFLIILINFGCIILIYKILKITHPDHRFFGCLIYAWNPLILFEAAQNGHNDFVMIFFLLLAIYLYIKKKFIWVLPVLTLSVLIKFVYVLLIPLFLIFLLKQAKNKKLLFLLKTIFISLFLTSIFYLPFWESFRVFSPVFTIGELWDYSLFPFVIKLFSNLTKSQIKIIVNIVFLLIYFSILTRAKFFSSANLIRSTFWILLSFIFISLTWVMHWYFAWPIAIGVLIKDKRYILLILSLTLIAFWGYSIPYLVNCFFFG